MSSALAIAAVTWVLKDLLNEGMIDGEFASHSNTYAGTGTLRVNW